MKKKAEKDKVYVVSVARAAELFNRDESTIRLRCKSGKLVARQESEGDPWEVFIPEKVYLERKKILELKRKSMQST
jgi:hypothetical protein